MKLHELVEGVTYLGEDGDEYESLDNSLCRIVLGVKYVVTKMSVLTQNFTPKKVKRTVELVEWHNIYSDGSKGVHPTKEEADKLADYGRISCVEMRGSYVVEE